MIIDDKKIKEIINKQCAAIEEECKKVLIKFDCKPTDLSVEYHNKTEVKIKVLGSQFEIINNFYFTPQEG